MGFDWVCLRAKKEKHKKKWVFICTHGTLNAVTGKRNFTRNRQTLNSQPLTHMVWKNIQNFPSSSIVITSSKYSCTGDKRESHCDLILWSGQRLRHFNHCITHLIHCWHTFQSDDRWSYQYDDNLMTIGLSYLKKYNVDRTTRWSYWLYNNVYNTLK